MKAYVLSEKDKPDDDVSASDLCFVFSSSRTLASGETRRKVKEWPAQLKRFASCLIQTESSPKPSYLKMLPLVRNSKCQNNTPK